MVITRRFPLSLLAVLLLCGNGPCDPRSQAEPEPEFGIKGLSISQGRARINDVVEFRWDFHRRSELKNYWIEQISLVVGGSMSIATQGCSPQQPNYRCNDINNGGGEFASSFQFTGPVTVVIGAESINGVRVKAAFDVNLTSTAYFRANLFGGVNTQYPRLGLPSNAAKVVEFPVFFAVYEDTYNNVNGQEDGRVNQLANQPGLSALFDPQSPFLGRSRLDNPQQRYGFSVGSMFPLLDALYLASADAYDASAGMSFNEARYRAADAVIVAAKLLYDGTVEVIQDDKGEDVEVHTGDLTMEPVFMQIDLRSEQQGQLHVVDMHVGNTSQGFVASAYYGLTVDRYLARGGYSASYDFPGGGPRAGVYATGVISGGAKDSKLGFNSGGLPWPLLVSDVSWNEVPFYSDNDIGGIQRCPYAQDDPSAWCFGAPR